MFQTFHLFDRDSDGCITAKELHTALWKLGCDCGQPLNKCKCDKDRFPSMEVCQGYVNEYDKDGDGALQLDEFVT